MRPLRLLLIDDGEEDVASVILELTRGGYAVAAERVDTPEALVAALDRKRFDIAIADFTMPAFSGAAALRLLRVYDADMPFIFVSRTLGEEAVVSAMKTGAQDYIFKGNLKRLVPAVERELRETAGRLSRKQAEARLGHLAYHDPLTDLPNRVLLYDRLQQAIFSAQRTGDPQALLFLDLNGFKTINDSLGHHAGDRLLQQVAWRLRTLLREGDTVARVGGDEFAVMLPRTDVVGATIAARNALRDLSRPIVVDGRSLSVGGSFGIACFPDHGSDASLLMQAADIAMYVAKKSGIGHAVYSPDRDRHAHRRLALTTELREAIDRDQFSLDYQPVVDLQTGEVLHVEALVRWIHPEHGCLPPGEFIELAEQNGLINPLTTLLLDKALAEWAGARRRRRPLRVAVNISPLTLHDPDLPARIAGLLSRHKVGPETLILEITENQLVSNAAAPTTCMARLHEMGVTLAIDDYGAGCSSLSYLQRLPVQQLKIDRSLVMGLTDGDDAIVRSTIDLAHRLGLIVVAEGIESAATRDRLAALRCDAGQGEFIVKPGSADRIRRWAAQQRFAVATHELMSSNADSGW